MHACPRCQTLSILESRQKELAHAIQNWFFRNKKIGGGAVMKVTTGFLARGNLAQTTAIHYMRLQNFELRTYETRAIFRRTDIRTRTEKGAICFRHTEINACLTRATNSAARRQLRRPQKKRQKNDCRTRKAEKANADSHRIH